MLQEVHCNECIALESMSVILALLYRSTNYPCIAHFTSMVDDDDDIFNCNWVATQWQ